MKPRLKRYAFIGLILSGLGLLTTIVAGLGKLLETFGLLTIQNLHVFGLTVQKTEDLDLVLEISLGVIIIGLALFTLMAPERVREFVTGRQARYGSNALVLSLAFLGILISINYLVYKNPKKLDMTESKEHTLATQTVDILRALPQNVLAMAFYTQRTSSDSARELLMDFQANSDGKFEYRFIDPELNPIVAQQAKVTRDGTIVLQMGDRHEIVTFASEEELTTALIRLINPQQRTVYFMIGHGEKDTESAGDASMTRLRQALEAKNYTVKTLNLRAQNRVPEDALVIIISGPLEPITKEETTLLDDYSAQGGSLIVMEDPVTLTNFGDTPDPLTEMLIRKWSITLDNDLVIDPSANPPLVAIANEYADQPITQKLRGVITLFPKARSIQIGSDFPNVNLIPLVKTTDRAWGETDIASIENNVQYNEGTDIPGPIILAVAAENTKTNARMVVIGNSEFAVDANFDAYGNGDLIINSVDWATKQEKLINLNPKEPIARQMKFLNQFQVIAVLLGAICLLPGLIILGGVTAWVTRRRRG